MISRSVRCTAGIAQTVRSAGRHPHETPWANPTGPLAGSDGDLALDDVEQLFDCTVHVVAGTETGCGDELDDRRTAGFTLAGCLENDFGCTKGRRLALAWWEIQLLSRHGGLLLHRGFTLDPHLRGRLYVKSLEVCEV